ncbi:MAG: hypothetical protein HXY40_06555 [Chloroflexi bacterium]|nr:hypothetical protein [Chloroflexota bacterium]
MTRKPGGDSFLVGGTAEDSTRWTRVLSQRAAQIVWFHLGRYLYPEKTQTSVAIVATAPMRNADAPTITSHAAVDKAKEGGYQIHGWAGDKEWSARLSDEEAQKFFEALGAALDVAEKPSKTDSE